MQSVIGQGRDAGLDSKRNGKPLESCKQRHGDIWLLFPKPRTGSARKVGWQRGSRKTQGDLADLFQFQPERMVAWLERRAVGRIRLYSGRLR